MKKLTIPAGNAVPTPENRPIGRRFLKPHAGFRKDPCEICGRLVYTPPKETPARTCSAACTDILERFGAKKAKQARKNAQKQVMGDADISYSQQPRFTLTQIERRRRSNARCRAKERHKTMMEFYDALLSGTISFEDMGRLTPGKALIIGEYLMSNPKTDLFTPAQAAKIRSRVATLIEKHVDTAGAVLDGNASWTNQQVRVFTALMNKIVPDLNASFHLHENVRKRVDQLSREELERIALGESNDIEIVDITPRQVPDLILEDLQHDPQPAARRDTE